MKDSFATLLPLGALLLRLVLRSFFGSGCLSGEGFRLVSTLSLYHSITLSLPLVYDYDDCEW